MTVEQMPEAVPMEALATFTMPSTPKRLPRFTPLRDRRAPAMILGHADVELWEAVRDLTPLLGVGYRLPDEWVGLHAGLTLDMAKRSLRRLRQIGLLTRVWTVAVSPDRPELVTVRLTDLELSVGDVYMVVMR